tara:strand:- start:504 stop:758 length:255 start_codon:yes stop_codon:yes gene_type:complete
LVFKEIKWNWDYNKDLKVDVIKVKGRELDVLEALHLFDIGELTEVQSYRMFQEFIDKGIKKDLPLPIQNATEVFIRCGICNKRR